MKKYNILLGVLALLLWMVSTTIAAEVPYPLKVETKEGLRYGYIDPSTLKWAIQPKFTRVTLFQESPDKLAWVRQPNGGWAIISTSGTKQTSPMPFDDIGIPAEGMAKFKLNGLWGYYSIAKDTFALQPTFLQARDFAEGLAAVEYKSGRWRFINMEGNKVGLRDFSFAYSFKKGRAIVIEEGGFYGAVNSKGDWLLPAKFGAVFPSEQDTRAIYLAGKVDKGKLTFIPYYEVVNSAGLANQPLKAEEVKPFSAYGAPVKINGQWGYIKPSGDILMEPQFEDAQTFVTSPVGAVKQDGLWGIIYFDPLSMTHFKWLVKPQWEKEPDMTLFDNQRDRNLQNEPNFSKAIIIVDGLFYNIEGNLIEGYANDMIQGMKALKHNNPTVAHGYFEQALEKDPNDPYALYMLGNK